MPDLLMVRAWHPGEGGEEGRTFVDLESWIGESLGNRRDEVNIWDDEFLGCSKGGDDIRPSVRTAYTTVASLHTKPAETVSTVHDDADCDSASPHKAAVGEPEESPPPAPLELRHEGKLVVTDCLFVEVKSAHDRLDGRQVDWLNILEGAGCKARVCQFVESKKRKDRSVEGSMSS
uniref:VRR-NUC domain-containing protein n=1 Tax=Corethron hystrix TaxID=216773 RepID=A0A7S1C041_9STRA